jgi:hypothetical protein
MLSGFRDEPDKFKLTIHENRGAYSSFIVLSRARDPDPKVLFPSMAFTAARV